MSIRLRRTLHLTLAAMMIASVGAASASNFNNNVQPVNASRRVRRRNHKTVKKGRRAPWKRAWSKYLKEEKALIYTNPRMFTLNAKRTRYAPSIRAEKNNYWPRYFNSHLKRGAFTNHLSTYPQYDTLSNANDNMYRQKHHEAWGLSFPSLWNHTGTLHNPHSKDVIRNSELLSNRALHGFTPHMLRLLHGVAIPAHNNRRVLTSFKYWMKRNHNHPRLNIQGHKYVFNKNNFAPAIGTNGYGNTYRFNTKTGHYVRVSSKKEAQRADNIQAILTQLQNKQNQKNKARLNKSIKNNPALSSQTKNIIILMTSDPNQISQNPQLLQGNLAQQYKAASQNSQITPEQRARLSYMSANLHNAIQNWQEQQQPSQPSDNTGLGYNQSNPALDILQLQLHGAFKNLTNSQENTEIQKLLQDPESLKQAMDHFDTYTAIGYTKHPTIAKVAANHYANNNKSQTKQSNGVITNDKGLAQQLALLQREINTLANSMNINVNSSTNQVPQD